MNASFVMPDFCADIKMNMGIFDLIKKYPYLIRPNTEINAFYGDFFSSIWNGGRFCCNKKILSKSEIEDIFNIYNYYLGVPLRLTCTNPILEEKHLYDTYSNLILECGRSGNNEVLVSSPLLEEYIRKNYPEYKICRSVLAAKDTPYLLDNKYHISVLNKQYNNNWDYLKNVPFEDRPKIELICNDACVDNCAYTYQHYQELGKATLNFNLSPAASCRYGQDQHASDFPYGFIKEQKHYINREMIDDKYLPAGFKLFKLVGRENGQRRVINWLNYILNPEYKEDWLCHILFWMKNS